MKKYVLVTMSFLIFAMQAGFSGQVYIPADDSDIIHAINSNDDVIVRNPNAAYNGNIDGNGYENKIVIDAGKRLTFNNYEVNDFDNPTYNSSTLRKVDVGYSNLTEFHVTGGTVNVFGGAWVRSDKGGPQNNTKFYMTSGAINVIGGPSGQDSNFTFAGVNQTSNISDGTITVRAENGGGSAFNIYGGANISGGKFTVFASQATAHINARDTDAHVDITGGEFNLGASGTGLASFMSCERNNDIEFKITGRNTIVNMTASGSGATRMGGKYTHLKLGDGAQFTLNAEKDADDPLGRVRLTSKNIDIANTTFNLGRNSYIQTESVHNETNSTPDLPGMRFYDNARLVTLHSEGNGEFGAKEAATIASYLVYGDKDYPYNDNHNYQGDNYDVTGVKETQQLSFDNSTSIDLSGRDLTIRNFKNTEHANNGTQYSEGVVFDGQIRFGGNGKNAAGDGTASADLAHSNEENVGNINIINASARLTGNTEVRLSPTLVQGMAEAIKANPNAYSWDYKNSTLLINANRFTTADNATKDTGGDNNQRGYLDAANTVAPSTVDYTDFFSDTVTVNGTVYKTKHINTLLGKFELVDGGDIGEAARGNLYIASVIDPLDFSKDPADTINQINKNIDDVYGPNQPFSPGVTDAIIDVIAGQIPQGTRNPAWDDRVINPVGETDPFVSQFHYNFLDALANGEGYGTKFQVTQFDENGMPHRYDYFTSRGLAEYYMGSHLSKVVQLNHDTARSTIRNVANRFDWIHRQGDDREQAVYNAIKSGDAYATFMLPNLEYCISNRVWASAIGQWDRGSTSKVRNLSGYSYNAAGAMIGLEHEHGPFTVGIAGSYMGGKYRDDIMDWNNSRINSYSVNAYATWTSCNKWFITALAGYMHADNKLNFKTADMLHRQKFGSNSWYVEGKVGHDFWFGCTGQERFRITPAVALGYINTRSQATRGYNETIGYHTARFDRQKLPSWYLPITVEAVKDWDLCNGGRITLNVNGGYTYNSRMEGTDNNMTMLGLNRGPNHIPVNYKTWGQRRSHGQWNAGVKLGYTARKWEVNVGYDWFGRQNANTHRLNATLGIYF